MPAAILTCGLLMTSCFDRIDNPVEPSNPETPSAVDNGKWTIDDRNMDLSVKPGDNFFMYCNGSWWAATTPKSKFDIPGFESEATDAYQTKLKKLADPTLDKFNADAKNIDKTAEEANAYLKALYKKSGWDDAKTVEDCWRAMGLHTLYGGSSFLKFDPMMVNGKCGLVLFPENEPDYLAESDSSSETSAAGSRRVLTDTPDFLRSLKPLGSRAGTRGIGEERWPMVVEMVKAMGFDPADIYMVDDYYKVKDPNPSAKMIQEAKRTLVFLDSIQKLDVKGFTAFARLFLGADSMLVSTGAMDLANKMFKKTGAGIVLSPKSVTEKMGNYLRYERSKLVADNLVTPEMKAHGRAVVKELLDVFKRRVEASDWMSAASKRNAIEKADAMIINIGSPDAWFEAGLPDLSASASLLEDVCILRLTRTALLKEFIGKSRHEVSFHEHISDINDPSASLETVNAFYSHNFNAMNIYPVWLMPIFYDAAQNEAINYDTYTTFSHELTHGFDTNGAEFDKEGRIGTIWASDADKAEFLRRANLLSDWMSTLDVLPDELPGKKANGKATVTEDIADLGGLNISYQAYCEKLAAEGFTGEQLRLQKQRYFRAVAEHFRARYTKDLVNYFVYGVDNPSGPDPHSMTKERVNGPLPLFDDWYDLFGVKPGDALYLAPEKRIRIW